MYGTYFGLYSGNPQAYQHKNQMKEDTIIQLIILPCMLHVSACTQAILRHVNTNEGRYNNSIGDPSMHAIRFGLYPGHPQACQHKNQMTKDTIIQLVTLP